MTIEATTAEVTPLEPEERMKSCRTHTDICCGGADPLWPGPPQPRDKSADNDHATRRKQAAVGWING